MIEGGKVLLPRSGSTASPPATDIESSSSVQNFSVEAAEFVSRIWSDARVLVDQFNRNFRLTTNNAKVEALSFELECGLIRIVTCHQPRSDYALRLEVEFKRNSPQLIRTLRETEIPGTAGRLVLCDRLHFIVEDGGACLAGPDCKIVQIHQAAKTVLKPLLDRAADLLHW